MIQRVAPSRSDVVRIVSDVTSGDEASLAGNHFASECMHIEQTRFHRFIRKIFDYNRTDPDPDLTVIQRLARLFGRRRFFHDDRRRIDSPRLKTFEDMTKFRTVAATLGLHAQVGLAYFSGSSPDPTIKTALQNLLIAYQLAGENCSAVSTLLDFDAGSLCRIAIDAAFAKNTVMSDAVVTTAWCVSKKVLGSCQSAKSTPTSATV